MAWAALRYEIALEMHELAPTMWDAWDMWCPTRTEADRLAMERAETKRRASVLMACGRVRDARKIESYRRAWKRRKAKR